VFMTTKPLKIYTDGKATITVEPSEQPGRQSITIAADTIAVEDQEPTPIEPPAPDLNGWIAVDPHTHLHGSNAEVTPEQTVELMELHDLHVVCPLAWGYLDGWKIDRHLLTGEDHPASKPGRVLHVDFEHSQTPSAHLGHLVTHGASALLEFGHETTIPIAKRAREQGAVIGMAHCQSWPAAIEDTPANAMWADVFPGYPPRDRIHATTPYEAPILAALGLLDYLSVESTNNDGTCLHPGAALLWRHLLNCGFQIGLVGGSDFTCVSTNPHPGKMRTLAYVGPTRAATPNYDDAILSIEKGKTIVKTEDNKVLDLTVVDLPQVGGPGKTVDTGTSDKLTIGVTWPGDDPITLQLNGKPATNMRSGETFETWAWSRSGWLSASTPTAQTSAIYVNLDGKPTREQASIDWLLTYIDRLTEMVHGGLFGDGAKEALPYYAEARAKVAAL
jgi:hypothetical protein